MVRRVLLLAAVMALAGCQFFGGLEAKELVVSEADAGEPGGEPDAGKNPDAATTADAAVACGAASELDDVVKKATRGRGNRARDDAHRGTRPS